jgi:hypothetical protein
MSTRNDILTGLRASQDSTVGDLTPENLVDAYRAEVLREAAAMARALRKYGPAVGTRAAAQVSENVGLLAASAALEAAADDASTPVRPPLPRRTPRASRSACGSSWSVAPARASAGQRLAAGRASHQRIADLDVPLARLEQQLAELRSHAEQHLAERGTEPTPEHWEQWHAFLDIDPDLRGRDYTGSAS